MKHLAKHCRALALVFTLVGCYSASVPKPPSGQDGKTGWLTRCAVASDCGSGLDCACGVCTATCDDDKACGTFGAGAVCVGPQRLQLTCSEPVSSGAGLCLRSCASGQSCASEFECTQGFCSPHLATSVTSDAGTLPHIMSRDAADAGRMTQQQTRSARDAGKPSDDAGGGDTLSTDDAGVESLMCSPGALVCSCGRGVNPGAYCGLGQACLAVPSCPSNALVCGPQQQVCGCKNGAYCLAAFALCKTPDSRCP